MHELALMDDLVQTVVTELEDARVLRVRVIVGRMSGVVVDSLRFCFDVCAQGTSLEGATFDVVETNGDELRLEEVEVI